jgi:hypothetical protein
MSIDRLATANPIPAPATRFDEALFAQIVAQPRERDARRRPRKRVAVAVVFAAGLLVTSTAVGVDRWLTGAVKPPVTRNEYAAAQSLLRLPPGTTWPTLHVDPNSMTGRGAGGGYAVGIAMTKWQCYWAQAIRDHDVAAQRRSHAVLESLLTKHVVVAPNDAPEDWQPADPPAFPYAIYADDGGYQFEQRNIAKAAAGDASGIAQSCTANS